MLVMSVPRPLLTVYLNWMYPRGPFGVRVGAGGTIQFEYTVNNGRGTNIASITVAPGQTTASYSFLWSGNLPTDHTYPEAGGVIVHSPNEISSSLLGPSGRCS